MPIVRQEQVDTLQSSAQRNFADAVKKRLRERYGGYGIGWPGAARNVGDLPEAALASMVDESIAAAQGYGLKLQSSIFRFVLLMFLAGPEFHEQPAIHAALEDRSLPEEMRMDRLWRVTTEKDWESAQKQALLPK